MNEKDKAREAVMMKLEPPTFSEGKLNRHIWREGFRAGYNAHSSGWVRIEGPESLPKDTNIYLISVDWYNDTRSTDFASYRDMHWWSERTDGYGDPIKLCDDGRVIAWREMPEPFTE